jgi:hypothetical protein
MRVHAPMLSLRTPVGEQTEVEGSLVIDSMSGASPLYHDTLSGASGKGIQDVRRAGDMKVSRYFERFSIGVGGGVSAEDDYFSEGGFLESKIWSEDKNTIVSFGGGGHYDEITSSDSSLFQDHRRTWDYGAGVTQILTPLSQVQTNITYSNSDGYLSDPYKGLDYRPRSRDQWAWLIRYVQALPEWGGSLHSDYRYYWDSWDVHSHTFEVALYQPINDSWAVVPVVRYYSQGAASFFSSVYPPEDFEGFYSADQRVSAFGSVTTGIKFVKDFGSGWSADTRFDFLQQHASWKLGSGGSSRIDPFYGYFFVLGLNKKF